MKISIITVCLNSEKTIEQTIQSVITQKDENTEYIIIDGKSTDGTLNIIDKYRNVIDIVISEPDYGIYDAMNKGISLATGEIIGIINSDDWYEEEAFRKVRKCFDDSKADIVYGKMNLISPDRDMKLLTPTNIEKLRYEMEIPHPTAFVKKEIYVKYGMFSLDYRIAADYEFMLRLFVQGVKFFYLDEIIANFRLDGISNKQIKKCAYETLVVSKKYLTYCPLNERERLEQTVEIKWKSFCFRQLMDECPDCFLEYINKKSIGETKHNIAIFGAGKWGTEIYHLLSDAGIRPCFLIDNNKNLWDRPETEIQVSPPDVLKTFHGILLVLIKGASKEILSQVREINNPVITCITWEELADEFKDHVLPG